MGKKLNEKIKEKLMESCTTVRYLVVCKDDEITVRVGRYFWQGKVLEAGKMGLVILNGNAEHSIALNKIGSITIINEGKYRKAFREVYGKTTFKPKE